MDYDVIIAGAGVVGLAVGYLLSENGFSVLVIEKNCYFGEETSSRNSEVIHAGIYYPKNSLKAELCVQGRKMLYDYCDSNYVPYKKIGKYIIAANENEKVKLHEILKRGIDNGVENFSIADLDEMREKNPGVRAAACLFSKETCIIDSHKLMESFIYKIKLNGSDIIFNHEVCKVNKIENGYCITAKIDDEYFEVTCKYFVNSAGLNSDILASKCGIDIEQEDLKLKYFKGHYFRLRSSKNHLVSNLIYPVPPANNTGLGIHVTLDIGGGVKFGPDAVYLDDRKLDYSVPEDLKSKFYEAVSRYLVDISINDLYPDQAGIRPKLSYENQPVRDFYINEESHRGLPGLINLIGIESPGLTSCLAIGEMVRKYIEK